MLRTTGHEQPLARDFWRKNGFELLEAPNGAGSPKAGKINFLVYCILNFTLLLLPEAYDWFMRWPLTADGRLQFSARL